MFKWIFTVLITILLAGCSVQQDVVKTTKSDSVAVPVTQVSADTVKLEFPSEKYPETAQHIKEAIAAGIPNVCTIDRGGVFKNREISLESVPVKKGYKRGQWPLATCAESKVGADVSYISPKDDEGANSWIDQHLEDYSDGTRVEFIVK